MVSRSRLSGRALQNLVLAVDGAAAQNEHRERSRRRRSRESRAAERGAGAPPDATRIATKKATGKAVVVTRTMERNVGRPISLSETSSHLRARPMSAVGSMSTTRFTKPWIAGNMTRWVNGSSLVTGWRGFAVSARMRSSTGFWRLTYHQPKQRERAEQRHGCEQRHLDLHAPEYGGS